MGTAVDDPLIAELRREGAIGAFSDGEVLDLQLGLVSIAGGFPEGRTAEDLARSYERRLDDARDDGSAMDDRSRCLYLGLESFFERVHVWAGDDPEPAVIRLR
jgi:hypothetical protein